MSSGQGPAQRHARNKIMKGTNIETVRMVLEAIRTQDADRAVRYVDPHFVQHSPFMAGGVEGFKQYITTSPPEQRNLMVVRAFEDGPFVVAQLNAQSAGQDLFVVYRFRDGLIAEHWVFSAPGGPPNQSGHTQLDGPTEVRHLEDTERNKAFVRGYYETFHIAGDHGRSEQYFSEDVMIRHEPGVRDGLANFLHDVSVLMQHRTIDEIKLLLGQGDLVFIAARGTHEGDPCLYIDLYRVENGKIVEHWGFPEKVPPREEWKNNNGML